LGWTPKIYGITISIDTENLVDLEENQYLNVRVFNLKAATACKPVLSNINSSTELIILPWISSYNFLEDDLLVVLQKYPKLKIQVEGDRSLFYLAAFLGFLKLSKFLYETNRAIDIDAVNGNYNQTALFIASDKGQVHTVKYLLEKGANLNKTTTYGYSPLMVSAYKGELDVLLVLLHHGADIKQQDKNGRDVFYWYEQKRDNQNPEILRSLKLFAI